MRTLLAVNPLDVPGFADIGMDLRVLLFTISVLIATALVVELLPAWRATRVSLAETLKGSGTGAVSARRFDFGADLVVIGQIALAAVVVVAAALMVRSFYNITRLDLGFAQERVLTFGLELPDSEFTTLEAKQQAFEQLLSRLSSRPGVEAAGAIYQRPLAHGPIGMDARFLLEGQPVERASFDKNPIANWESVTPGYFAAMRVGLSGGAAVQRDRHEGCAARGDRQREFRATRLAWTAGARQTAPDHRRQAGTRRASRAGRRSWASFATSAIANSRCRDSTYTFHIDSRPSACETSWSARPAIRRRCTASCSTRSRRSAAVSSQAT